MAGVAIGVPGVADQMLKLFPQVNFVRLPCGQFQGPDVWGAFVTRMTGLGIVCEIEYHPWPLVNAPSGSLLQQEVAFYTNWAKWGLGNPYLMFGSMNEPQGGAISAEHAAVYQAIRGTGNSSLIILECGIGAGDPGALGAAVLDPTVYRNMTGILWGLHIYGWMTPSTDQATVNARVLGAAAGFVGIRGAQTVASVDGLVPVVIEETGPSTTGTVIDANAAQIATAVCQWAWSQNYTSGFCGWHWDADVNNAVQKNGVLTAWGSTLAADMQAVATYHQGVPVASPPLNANAQPGAWQSFTYQSMPWFLLPPDGYNPAYSYPAILFLHQYEDESGQPDQTNPWFNTAAFRAAHPCFVIVPRCQIGNQTSTPTFNWGGVDPNLQQPIVYALTILQNVISGYSIDINRVYLTGNSMGGLGTWGVLCNANQRSAFAAAMPVSGSCYYQIGNEGPMSQQLATLPIWSCHGAQDTQVPPKFDETIMPLLLKLNPANRFTHDPNGQHDTWDSFYPDPNTWNWLFSQTKGVSMSVPPASSDGTVVTPGGGSINDGQNNVYRLDTAFNAIENNSPIPNGGGTAQLAWYHPMIYGQDRTSLKWYAYLGNGTWTPMSLPGTSPPPVTTPPPVTSPPPVTTPPPVTSPPPSVTHLTLTAQLTQVATLLGQATTSLAQANALLTTVGQGLTKLTP